MMRVMAWVCGQCVNARGPGSRYNSFGPDAGASVVEALQNMTRLKTLNLRCDVTLASLMSFTFATHCVINPQVWPSDAAHNVCLVAGGMAF